MKRLAFIVFLLPALSWAGTPTLLQNQFKSGNAATTDPVDTTGVTLIILGQSCFGNVCTPPTDNKNNGWTALTQQNAGNRESIWYSSNPVVGSGHTFTGCSIDYGIVMEAFNNTDQTADPLDQQTGATLITGSTQNTGSITPSGDGYLVISYLGVETTVTNVFSVSGSFSITDQAAFLGGLQYGQAMAYWVQPTAGSVSVTWTASVGMSGSGATIASFKPSSGSPPPSINTDGTLPLMGL